MSAYFNPLRILEPVEPKIRVFSRIYGLKMGDYWGSAPDPGILEA
jgi:hypothetical protein